MIDTRIHYDAYDLISFKNFFYYLLAITSNLWLILKQFYLNC